MGRQDNDGLDNFLFDIRCPLFPGPQKRAAVVSLEDVIPEELFGLLHHHADALMGAGGGRVRGEFSASLGRCDII